MQLRTHWCNFGRRQRCWWLLLCATLSGLTVGEADETARLLVDAAVGAP